VQELLIAFGRDPEREPELRDTAKRVVEAYATELLAGRQTASELITSARRGDIDGAELALALTRREEPE